MSYLLALDQGTTSSRSVLYDREGSVAGVGQREFRQIFPRPGWVEHDPEEIWSSQRATIDEALAAAGVPSADVAGIGITNQRETTLVWDRADGKPIHNAIVWQDRRTADRCERLRADGVEDLFRRKTGLLLDPYFSGTKLAWLLENVDGARARAEAGELAFGTVDTWLAYRLSGGALHITDPGNASRTLLYDLAARAWDPELLDILGVPAALLPEVRRSAEIYGTADEHSGLPGRPLAGIAGDQQAATVGQLCIRPGMAKNTYGTGCFLLMNTGAAPRPSRNRLLTTVGWQIGDDPVHCLEGSVFTGGAAIQWLRDGLRLIASAADVEPLAASVPDSDGVVFVPALTGLGAPHWDPYARGTLLGLTRGTTAAHLARAVLEGIAFSVVDLVHAMEADAGQAIEALRVDGGAAANDLLLQIQADLLQRPVIRPPYLETTALGAAYLAGVATGIYASLEAIAELPRSREARRFEPRMAPAQATALHARWLEGIERAKGWQR